MLTIKYPLRMRSVVSGNIVEFTGLTTRKYIEIARGSSCHKLGEICIDSPHTDRTSWIPVKPITTLNLKDIYANY